jgi:hypothetical protein
MKITRQSPISGEIRTFDLDITEEEILNYQNGALIQDAFPRLNADEREFIKTGITGEEWNFVFN